MKSKRIAGVLLVGVLAIAGCSSVGPSAPISLSSSTDSPTITSAAPSVPLTTASSIIPTTTAPSVAPVVTAPPATAPARVVTTHAVVAPVKTTTHAAPAETVFADCKALNAVYPHGVGRAGAVDQVSGSSKPVTDFYVDTALYEANSSHDGDGDGIACEKH